MMDTKIRNFAPLPDLSLEELVPKDNFYRHLDRKLDLPFVRDFVIDCYACSGCPSVDPVVFFRLQVGDVLRKYPLRRNVWVEPLFAEAKDWHGMRRFGVRRLEKVNIEALLIASGQNVKRLLAFGGRSPKKLVQAAALRPSVATGHEIGRTRKHLARRSWWPTRVFFNTLVGWSEDVRLFWATSSRG